MLVSRYLINVLRAGVDPKSELLCLKQFRIVLIRLSTNDYGIIASIDLVRVPTGLFRRELSEAAERIFTASSQLEVEEAEYSIAASPGKVIG